MKSLRHVKSLSLSPLPLPPLSQVLVTFDDQFLLTASGDGSLLVWKILDKEGRGLRDKEVHYTEEILITKTDLEEKVWGGGGFECVSVCGRYSV